MTADNPRVTIALPVYNGQQMLLEAVDSVLSQTFDDFELLISDNASTDATPELCGEIAARDPRVRVQRHEENIGSWRNFNSVVSSARGECFRWMGDDDVLAPTYLEECWRALESRPEAVLAQSSSVSIDADGKRLPVARFGIGPGYVADRGPRRKGLSARSTVLRAFAAAATVSSDSEFYGLIRTPALRATQLNRGYFGDDRSLVLELALLGPFAEAPPELWYRRRAHVSWEAMSRRQRAVYYADDGTALSSGERLRRDARADVQQHLGTGWHARAVNAAARAGYAIFDLQVTPKRPSTRRRMREAEAREAATQAETQA